MKKILIFSYHLNGTGGTESVLNAWFNNLNLDSGYKLDLLIYGGQPDLSFLKAKSVSVIHKEDTLKSKIIALYKLRNQLAKNKYDYVICLGLNTLKAVQIALKTLPKVNTKVFYWTHFRVENSQFNEKVEKQLSETDGIITLCEGMTEQFYRFNLDRNKIHTIYNPVTPVDSINFKPRSKDSNNFYYIGRLDENQKRVSDIIKAFHLLINKEKIKARLTIIGIGDSYDFYEYLIKKYKLEDSIELCDLWFKDPWDYIKEIDALILSSNFEGFGMVIAEALTRGVPVISSNCSVGPADLIQNGHTGYLYEVGDLLALKECIKKVINKEISTSQEEISKSLEKMYIENYFARVKEIFQ
ncbi:glycosyltransferase [Actinobacillus capsulatus]|uniref:glycosyltransferase n=1 Tax=Actinobacillus capsulatus TaxID=717 RepID=UPI00037FC77A|nr:glycosyltransferase [Actinobacillus capsulatus]